MKWFIALLVIALSGCTSGLADNGQEQDWKESPAAASEPPKSTSQAQGSTKPQAQEATSVEPNSQPASAKETVENEAPVPPPLLHATYSVRADPAGSTSIIVLPIPAEAETLRPVCLAAQAGHGSWYCTEEGEAPGIALRLMVSTQAPVNHLSIHLWIDGVMRVAEFRGDYTPRAQAMTWMGFAPNGTIGTNVSLVISGTASTAVGVDVTLALLVSETVPDATTEPATPVVHLQPLRAVPGAFFEKGDFRIDSDVVGTSTAGIEVQQSAAAPNDLGYLVTVSVPARVSGTVMSQSSFSTGEGKTDFEVAMADKTLGSGRHIHKPGYGTPQDPNGPPFQGLTYRPDSRMLHLAAYDHGFNVGGLEASYESLRLGPANLSVLAWGIPVTFAEMAALSR